MAQAQTVEPNKSAAPPPGAGPPDINAETYPFDVVLQNLDKAAYIHVYSAPAHVKRIAGGFSANTCGVEMRQSLHRFSTPLVIPPRHPRLAAGNLIGEAMATLDHRWIFIPDNYQAHPGEPAHEVEFMPDRAQRFVMAESEWRFRGGKDGFRGFGSGMTYPSTEGGRAVLLAGAVGTITEGYGRFAGAAGTYTLVGRLCPDTGFTGSILLRVMDPEDRLAARYALPSLQPGPICEPETTYIMFRGQKRGHDQKTGFLFGPNGDIVGLFVQQQLRLIRIDSACGSGGRPHAAAEMGPVIGEMSANIRFNLTNPGAPGSNEAPIPFVSANKFTFYDCNGQPGGSIESDGGEGRTFRLVLPGAPRQGALRFGAFLPITKGTGWFDGIEGMMTDNSAVGIAPHAIATFYVMRIHDPRGRFRTSLREAWC
jgi:hypothetical protein